MKKVGLVIGQLGYGGAEKQVVLLALGLRETRRYEPVVFCLSSHVEPNGDYLNEHLITWYEVPANIENSFQKAWWLCRQTRVSRISLLYGFLNVGNVYAAIAGVINRLPFICSIRNADPSLPWWLRILSGWSCNRANFIVANSVSCARSLNDDLKVKHKRVRIIENALDFWGRDDETGEGLRAEWGIPKDSFVIGTVSNLKIQKNPVYFIDIFRAIAKKLPTIPVYFVWVGDGPERPRVESAISDFGAEMKSRIVFPGARRDIPEVLKSFDLFILTSSYEGLPNALMEAMAAGLPCVATNVSGTQDLLLEIGPDEEICVLTSPSNPEEFSTALTELITNPLRMRKMGETARRYVRHRYSLEKMVLAHSLIFDEVLGFQRNEEPA